MVSLQWVMRADTRQHFCGGVIVAQRWTLTAANCVSNNLPVVGRLEAVAGLYELDDWENAQSVKVRRLDHPTWIRGRFLTLL